MSNCQNKMVKRFANLVALITGVIVVAAIALGIVFGVKGTGVFNKNAILDDVKTLTVSMDEFLYNNNLDKVEDTCESVFGNTKVSYEMKGAMSGECEIVYVFDKDADVKTLEETLEKKFNAMTNDDGELKGSFITVASNEEDVKDYLAQNYVLRGVIAGVVLVAVVYVYAAIRFGIGKGVSVAFGTFWGMILTVAIIIVTRIPVTVSISYVFAVAALLSAIMSILSMNKIVASEKSEDENACGCAGKEILPISIIAGAALIVVGALALSAAVWFVLAAFIAVVAASIAGIIIVPTAYAPIKAAAAQKPAKDAYVGAVKTSTKAKKTFAKKEVVKAVEEPVVEEAMEEPAEEIPAEEVVEKAIEEAPAEEVVEEATEEEVAEETAEEVVEEAPAEEVIEETTEEVAEEPAVEVVEEAPAEEVAEEPAEA